MREYTPDANRLRGNEWEWVDGMEGGTTGAEGLMGEQEYVRKRVKQQIREDEEGREGTQSEFS